jgi:Tfp pilus assembly protein PilP
MMTMARLGLICAVFVLAVIPVHAQSSAAVSAARGAAASAGAPAREARAARQATPAPASRGTAAPAPASAPDSAEPTPAAKGTAEQPIEPVGFAYKPEGRRDPFVSLSDRGSDTRAGGPRPSGLAGLGAGEVTLRGTLRSRDGFVAMLQGVDQKTYIVRPGDKLFDGTVSSISQNDLVILQQVNDPLSLEKQREVRKGLRQAEAN